MPQRKGGTGQPAFIVPEAIGCQMKLLCLLNQQLRGMLEIAVPQQSDPVS